VTPGGDVLEGGATNVFCVRRGELLTPPVAMGLLPGVMRRFVLAAAREVLGVSTREARIGLRDLLRADEVFVTNAVIGAVPVRRIDGKTLSGKGQLARALMGIYDRVARPNRTRESGRTPPRPPAGFTASSRSAATPRSNRRSG
jgi:branched-subunit amino acid aminotransferase/4-amino-4-deoxychorismate lyase